MAAVETQQPPAEAAPAVPDYLASPNAVFDDEGVQWRYGRAPDYSKTRKVWEEGKKMNHAAGSLPQLVENLVKNWEVEASFKPRLSDWRTIDHNNYTFAINGGPPQTAEHMLKVGTYNAIIAPNEYYSPENSDFASSHKTFKRMMPTFAWEVIEVYSGPPRVAFKWRHWGVMKNDYVGFNDKGEKITAKAHGGAIDIEGVTVAQVDDKVRLQSVETWFDPLEMFRQIAPQGIINRETMNKSADKVDALDLPSNDGVKIAEAHNSEQASEHSNDAAPEDVLPKHVSNSTGQPADAFVPHQGADTEKTADSLPTADEPAQIVVNAAAEQGADAKLEKPVSNFDPSTISSGERTSSDSGSDGTDKTWEKVEHPADVDASSSSIYSSAVSGEKSAIPVPAEDESAATGTHDALDEHLEKSADTVHPHPKDVEQSVQPGPGAAVAASASSEETRATHEEMSRIGAGECPFLMNRE